MRPPAFVIVALGHLMWLAEGQNVNDSDLLLDYDTAVKLAALPLECFDKEYPHKFGLVYNTSDDVKEPHEIHPIFYGCFDWHSSVHGHWLLASVMNRFPGTELAEQVADIFDQQLTASKVLQEVELFEQDYNKAFERTYGWAWLLKLQTELRQSILDPVKKWSQNLQPLVDKIVANYEDFLPKLVYPVRVGEHPNTAFGLIFAHEYAKSVGNNDLVQLITHNSSGLFSSDQNCPLDWEPSGYDFLSPCLQEADLMGRVAPEEFSQDFIVWLQKFLPELFDEDFHLEPGHVIDRTDGKLVHLDGVNFSRAWNLYSLITKLPANQQAEMERFLSMGDEHVRESKDFVVGSDYAGSHWLASFLVYSLQLREAAVANMPTDQ